MDDEQVDCPECKRILSEITYSNTKTSILKKLRRRNIKTTEEEDDDQ